MLDPGALAVIGPKRAFISVEIRLLVPGGTWPLRPLELLLEYTSWRYLLHSCQECIPSELKLIGLTVFENLINSYSATAGFSADVLKTK